jgi:hypothetical protein
LSQLPLRIASVAPEPRSPESIFAAIRLPEPQKQSQQESTFATSFNAQRADGIEDLWPDLPADPGPSPFELQSLMQQWERASRLSREQRGES